jgi:hypothetical protein
MLIEIARDKSLPLRLRRCAVVIARHFPTVEDVAGMAVMHLHGAYRGTRDTRRAEGVITPERDVRTKNLRAVQILLSHTTLESTVRNLGIDVEDALEMAEPEA